MAILTLSKTWINRMDDPSTLRGCYTKRGRERNLGTDGEVRTYANGRRRNIVQDGIKETLSFVLLRQSVQDVDQLETWLDAVVQIRTFNGVRIWGVFHSMKVLISEEAGHAYAGDDLGIPYGANLWHDVEMMIEEITFTDEV